MIWPILVIIVTILLFVLMLIITDDNAVFVWIGGLSLTVAVLMLMNILEVKRPTPTALDVYRGKTTLEITYRDSMAIDSTVVYKVR